MNKYFTTYTNKIDAVKSDVLAMGELVYAQLYLSLNSFLNNSFHRTTTISDNEQDINKIYDSIQSNTLNLITIQPPLQHELIELNALLRISKEFERIGDHAVNIAEIGMAHRLPKGNVLSLFKGMSQQVLTMLPDSLYVLKTLDLEAAESVQKMDEEVDQFFLDIQECIIREMQQNIGLIPTYAHIVLINRYLERSADHVVNITRQVTLNNLKSVSYP